MKLCVHLLLVSLLMMGCSLLKPAKTQPQITSRQLASRRTNNKIYHSQRSPFIQWRKGITKGANKLLHRFGIISIGILIHELYTEYASASEVNITKNKLCIAQHFVEVEERQNSLSQNDNHNLPIIDDCPPSHEMKEFCQNFKEDDIETSSDKSVFTMCQIMLNYHTHTKPLPADSTVSVLPPHDETHDDNTSPPAPYHSHESQDQPLSPSFNYQE